MLLLLNPPNNISRSVKFLILGVRNLNSAVPEKPHISSFKNQKSNVVKIDIDTIIHLERLSLVNFGNFKGVEILESAIQFSEQLFVKDTTGIKPLTTVLENRILHLRNDIIKDGNCRESIMANAKITEEEYFVAPPGNIPLESLNLEVLKKKN